MPLCSVLFALSLVPLQNVNIRPNPENNPELTLERILSGEFSETGFEPGGEWMEDGKSLLSQRDGNIVKIDPLNGKEQILVKGEKLKVKGKPISIEDQSFSSDGHTLLIFTNSQKVWRQRTRGDYWTYNLESEKLLKLGGDAPDASLMFAKLSPDGTKAGYVQGNDIYIEDLSTGKVKQITDDGDDTTINGTFDWVYEEEFGIRDGWRWSPDGSKIAYFQVDSSDEPMMTLIDDTDSKYPKVKQFPYPKTGETNPTVRIGVVAASGGRTKWIEDEATSDSGYIARMDWAANSDDLIYERLNREQNTLEYKIGDPKTGESKTVFKDTDETWVDVLDTGPTGVRWIDDGGKFLCFSEKSGWRHIYAVSREDKEATDLTPGEFDVEDLSGVSDGKGIYFTASPENSTQRYLFRSSFRNPKPEQVTPKGVLGSNDYRVFPSGKYAFHRHSSFGKPSERELVSLPDHKPVRLFGDNSDLRAKLKMVRIGQALIVPMKTADGQAMSTSLVFPPNFEEHKRYPVFFQVYGEPAGTMVHDSWEGFNYMFAQMIAQKGYIVASTDNRGTPALKGRAWRKCVYKKIGITASEDQAAAVKQLEELPFVDSGRIGIWGWSGGGSMTLNMMFRYPDLYKLGMAVAPVPDVNLYDSIYQERYMGLPQKNPDAYRDCSPITYAKQLKGSLLIVHGSGDDNVHYQGTERLVNELVANDKPFQLMVYPNRTHAISEGPGTTKHLYELLVRYLTTNMPPGPKEK